MVALIQEIEENDKYRSKDKLIIQFGDGSDIYDTFRNIITFLQGMTFNNSVIYHGICFAKEELEELIECDAHTYLQEKQPTETENSDS